ncbi:hypothetical protein C7S16_3512 [Burkholderia thailandensis]|uniref:Uncharacterized protein n=1 Tax=Burkholderia thailandensis TaxID=57975 RepID=A0AAW9CVK5_BURTH|nr:hypothetical protein [Burkholderia thailandensis]
MTPAYVRATHYNAMRYDTRPHARRDARHAMRLRARPDARRAAIAARLDTLRAQ